MFAHLNNHSPMDDKDDYLALKAFQFEHYRALKGLRTNWDIVITSVINTDLAMNIEVSFLFLEDARNFLRKKCPRSFVPLPQV